jgi:RimJ/RimL family protein N-acetyltransferase
MEDTAKIDFSESAKLWTAIKTREINSPTCHFILIPMANMSGDVEFVERWFNDPEVRKFLHENTPFTDNPERRVSSHEFVEYMFNSPKNAYFKIWSIDGKKYIGLASMHNVDYEDKSFTAGLVIGEADYRGKGYGTEISQMAIERAKEIGFKNISASVHIQNEPSLRLTSKTTGGGPGIPSDSTHLKFETKL